MAAAEYEQRGAPIRRLDAQVANQIAAGEVVERPASVVKELLENAIDAGATRVEAHLEDGGRSLIRVVDDGHGIAAEQAALAFERHATSKITAAVDLERVATYGFRGEALASIASVAKVQMNTRESGSELGSKVVGDGRGGLRVTPVSCAPGTDLRVADLFNSVPARREFLRTAATELGHVIRLFDAIALARIDLHLLLFHNDRKVSDYPPATNLLKRAATVFGSDVARHLQPISGTGDYRVEGALSAPTMSRGSSAGLTLVVDGRPVTDKTLVHAVRTAFGSRLPDRRHPVGVLCLSCPPATVDVNVHPGKTEVRFLSKRGVHAAVVQAVTEMLDQGAWLEAGDGTLPSTRKGSRPSSGPRVSQRRSFPSGLFDRPGADTNKKTNWRPSGSLFDADQQPAAATERPAPRPVTEHTEAPPRQTRPGHQDPSPITLICAGGPSLPAPTPAQFVGQSGRRWLLFSSQDALIFVDRRTAFETTAIAAGGVPSQRLMIPLRIALGTPLVDALRPAMVRMQRHGLELAAATGGGVLVRAAPRSISSQQLIELVRTLAGTLLAKGATLSSAQVHARIDSHMASATAPNAGDHVPAADAAAVAAALHNVPLPPKTTADGLSVVVVPLAEIERRALL